MPGLKDTNERVYESIKDMWQKELDLDDETQASELSASEQSVNSKQTQNQESTIGSTSQWYEGAKDYWNKKPATIEGVLEGYGKYHDMETEYSRKVLNDHAHLLPSKGRALEGGAGIGRISKAILQPAGFTDIDIQDCSSEQINQAKQNVPFVKNHYLCGFQDFTFDHQYDCIWLQWFLMYLHDMDLIKALSKCRENLTRKGNKSGLIFIKENAKKAGAQLDKSDNSIARSEFYFKVIFDTCGLKIIHKSYQPDWDPDLLPICFWVLKPIDAIIPIQKKQIKDKTFSIKQKLCEKLVRIEIADGRQYVGVFIACDKTGSIIINDALELVDLCPLYGFQHDLITPYNLTYPLVETKADSSHYPQQSLKVPKYVGSLNVNRKDLKRVVLDKTAQDFFNQMVQSIRDGNYVLEQSKISVAAQENKEQFLELINQKHHKMAQNTKQIILKMNSDQK